MVCLALAAPLACSTLVVLVEGWPRSTTAQAFCFGFEMQGGDEPCAPCIFGAEGRRRRPVRRREPSSIRPIRKLKGQTPYGRV